MAVGLEINANHIGPVKRGGGGRDGAADSPRSLYADLGNGAGGSFRAFSRCTMAIVARRS